MFDGIERLRYDHEIQFIEKQCAFISMGSKNAIQHADPVLSGRVVTSRAGP